MPLKPFINEFTNELGNNIKIDVRTHLDMGIDISGERVAFTGVNIEIEGPSSTSTNILTTNEARALMETLKKFFGSAT